jgi:hypothetical protein
VYRVGYRGYRVQSHDQGTIGYARRVYVPNAMKVHVQDDQEQGSEPGAGLEPDDAGRDGGGSKGTLPDSAGEEKLPEGERHPHRDPTAGTAPTAPGAGPAGLLPPLIHDVLKEEEAAAATALTVTGPAGTAATTNAVTAGNATTDTDNKASAVAEDAESASAGADTHFVGFEGARDQIIVVAKKNDMWIFLNNDAAPPSWWLWPPLTPIFLVSGMLSMVGLVVTLAHDIEDKRWYWLFIAGGVWQWLVSLPGYCGCCMPRF